MVAIESKNVNSPTPNPTQRSVSGGGGGGTSIIKLLAVFLIGIMIGRTTTEPSSLLSEEKKEESVPEPKEDESSPSSSSSNSSDLDWAFAEHADVMKKSIEVGSFGLTDKTTQHSYQIMYKRYLSPFVIQSTVLQKNKESNPTKPKFRMLEIGLGCSPRGGMVRGEPGGSTRMWKYLFPPDKFDLDLHVMEYDVDCAKKFGRDHPNIATKIHTGDQSNIADLNRIYVDSGSEPFDMIVDDGSHFNAHQIATFEHMIQHIRKGGFYVIEDIQSACKSWVANTGGGAYRNRHKSVAGTPGCMETSRGEPTIFSKLIEWQKPLLIRQSPFPDVTSIDISLQAAIISKRY